MCRDVAHRDKILKVAFPEVQIWSIKARNKHDGSHCHVKYSDAILVMKIFYFRWAFVITRNRLIYFFWSIVP